MGTYKVIRELRSALLVLILTEKTLKHLEQNDPKALKQARLAIWRAEQHLDIDPSSGVKGNVVT